MATLMLGSSAAFAQPKPKQPVKEEAPSPGPKLTPPSPRVATPRDGQPRPRPRGAPAIPTPPATQQPADNAALPSDMKAFETGLEYKPTPPGARITFNLEDADLPELVRLISQITGRRFILPGKVRSIKATVFAPTEVTAAEAYRAFLSILEMNGMTVVPAGRYLKIVETAGVEKQPLQTYVPGESTPGDDRYVTRMHRLSNLSADDVTQLLGRFSSSEGSITAYAPTNTIIITDTGTNIQRMMRILESIDVQRTGEQVWIEPVYYADASDLAKTLEDMFPSARSAGSGSPSSSSSASKSPSRRETAGSKSNNSATIGLGSGDSRVTKIVADERSNSLIIVATESAYLRMLEIIRELDKSLEGEGRIHIHYLQHGDAEQIASTLSNLSGNSEFKLRLFWRQGSCGKQRSCRSNQCSV
ncbi:MAG: hypothetical protein IPJ88_15120 [Myxococcales bacterium]|nr:MAG: hypothetical protein IPJ88_15120 [Myxococcales bacterium]